MQIEAQYIDHMGDDLRVSNAARVSFSKWRDRLMEEGDPELRVTGRPDAKLIQDLAKEGHFTPFTHCIISMRETMPVLLRAQRRTHKVGFEYKDFDYNEESRRYVSDTPEVWVPAEFRNKPIFKKQGSGGVHDKSEFWRMKYHQKVAECVVLYDEMIEDGVAPEQARAVLPQGAYTSHIVTGTLFAWARAYRLRSDPHAQQEIRELAAYWDAIIRPLFPHAWSALTS